MNSIQTYLKQIVYGGNDGIVTTFAIVSGFAGAQTEGTAAIGGLAVLVFGLANLFADGVSMGLGEFLSGRAEAGMLTTRRKQNMALAAASPDATRIKLGQLLADGGMDGADAAQAASLLARHPETGARLLMGSGLGGHLRPDRPSLKGMITFLAFVMFGIIPLIPYLLMEADTATMILSSGATYLALTALGLLRWRTSGEHIVRALGETLLVGFICANVAYAVGWLVGG